MGTTKCENSPTIIWNPTNDEQASLFLAGEAGSKWTVKSLHARKRGTKKIPIVQLKWKSGSKKRKKVKKPVAHKCWAHFEEKTVARRRLANRYLGWKPSHDIPPSRSFAQRGERRLANRYPGWKPSHDIPRRR